MEKEGDENDIKEEEKEEGEEERGGDAKQNYLFFVPFLQADADTR